MNKQIIVEMLRQIESVFDINTILQEKVTQNLIKQYYQNSNLGYKYIHSSEGSMHFALNFDGQFDKAGYHGQVRLIADFAKKQSKMQAILELGCGKGFNVRSLAREMQSFRANSSNSVNIVGIDLTPFHVKQAKKWAKKEQLHQVSFEVGNYENLQFENESFDLVFGIETVCHSTQLATVLQNANRVLCRGGHLVLFDGYRQANFSSLQAELQTAARLVELSMAVKEGVEITTLLRVAKENGFEVVKVEDISYAVMPNVLKLQGLAKRYFKHKLLAKLLLAVLPNKLLKNAIAGLLIPATLQAKAQGYFQVVLRKQD
jgi:ubiquinone/menaquinone biosynthesis C-methylase UbiE